jgi:hypothetical protein
LVHVQAKNLPKEEGQRFFPYGYLDCDWQSVYTNGATYCDPSVTSSGVAALCDRGFPGQPALVRSVLQGAKPILDKYANDASAWEADYAVAFCKLSDFGANYTTTKVSFQSLFTGPTTGCLDVASVLSTKQCPACEIANRDPSVMKDATPISPGTQQPITPPTGELLNHPSSCLLRYGICLMYARCGAVHCASALSCDALSCDFFFVMPCAVPSAILSSIVAGSFHFPQ